MTDRTQNAAEKPNRDEAARKDGLYLFGIGTAIFLLFGVALQFTANDAGEDFRAVVYGARCLLHHQDPYNESALFHYYQTEFPEQLAAHFRSHTLTLYVNLPGTLVVVAPFAALPFAAAFALWSVLTFTTFLLSAALIWDLASEYSPRLAGALIALSLINGAIVLGNGNPAGLVVALALISVWCFKRARWVLTGVFCLAASLIIKPHDSGFIWLYFVVVGGTLRKRAFQSLVAAVLVSLAGVLWVAHISPSWFPEFRANIATMSATGGNNDPGPSGPTTKQRSPEVILDLQSAISIFRDEARNYNLLAWLVCGSMFLCWVIVTLRSSDSISEAWLALAALAPLALLATYHRAYDARLLMICLPACAMLYAEKGVVGRLSVLITSLGLILTGEVPIALLNTIVRHLPKLLGWGASVEYLFLGHPSPLILLVMAIFYLWVFAARSSRRPFTPQSTMIKSRN